MMTKYSLVLCLTLQGCGDGSAYLRELSAKVKILRDTECDNHKSEKEKWFQRELFETHEDSTLTHIAYDSIPHDFKHYVDHSFKLNDVIGRPLLKFYEGGAYKYLASQSGIYRLSPNKGYPTFLKSSDLFDGYLSYRMHRNSVDNALQQLIAKCSSLARIKVYCQDRRWSFYENFMISRGFEAFPGYRADFKYEQRQIYPQVFERLILGAKYGEKVDKNDARVNIIQNNVRINIEVPVIYGNRYLADVVYTYYRDLPLSMSALNVDSTSMPLPKKLRGFKNEIYELNPVSMDSNGLITRFLEKAHLYQRVLESFINEGDLQKFQKAFDLSERSKFPYEESREMYDEYKLLTCRKSIIEAVIDTIISSDSNLARVILFVDSKTVLSRSFFVMPGFQAVAHSDSPQLSEAFLKSSLDIQYENGMARIFIPFLHSSSKRRIVIEYDFYVV